MFDRDKWELENQDLLKSWYDRGRGATRKIICGGIYDAKRKDSRYCSNACRQKAYRNRVKTAVEGTE